MKGVAAGMVRRARIWDIYRRRDRSDGFKDCFLKVIKKVLSLGRFQKNIQK